MERAFVYGLENRCPFAFVEAMSFQALGFYQKIGFKLEFARTAFEHKTSFHFQTSSLSHLVDKIFKAIDFAT